MSDAPLFFIGDSVTGAGRDRSDPAALGEGWVRIVADRLGRDRSRVLNRGIGGDRAENVEARWEGDCLAHRPAVVTLLVGINDVWRAFDRGDPRPVSGYRDRLERMVASAKGHGSEVILMEPFALPVGVVTGDWEAELAPRQAIVADVAARMGTGHVATQEPIEREAENVGPSALLPDGVHPSRRGHDLLARLWWDAASRRVLRGVGA